MISSPLGLRNANISPSVLQNSHRIRVFEISLCPSPFWCIKYLLADKAYRFISSWTHPRCNPSGRGLGVGPGTRRLRKRHCPLGAPSFLLLPQVFLELVVHTIGRDLAVFSTLPALLSKPRPGIVSCRGLCIVAITCCPSSSGEASICFPRTTGWMRAPRASLQGERRLFPTLLCVGAEFSQNVLGLLGVTTDLAGRRRAGLAWKLLVALSDAATFLRSGEQALSW